MKKLLLTIALLLPMLPMVAIAQDQSILIEFGIGLGKSGKITKTKEQMANKFNNKFCYHRPQGRQIFGAVRYRYDDVETHVAHWFGEADQARCERDSWAVGLGYVIDTQNDGIQGTDDYYASWTPGIAYTWGENKDFNVQDNTNTNWRMKNNWQMFNRVAVGYGADEDYAVEVAVVRYGFTNFERTGENFVTIGLMGRDLENNNGTVSTLGAGTDRKSVV